MFFVLCGGATVSVLLPVGSSTLKTHAWNSANRGYHLEKPQVRSAGLALPTRFSRTPRMPPRRRNRKAASPESGTCATHALFAHATDAPTPPKQKSRNPARRDGSYATSFIGKAKNRGVKGQLRATRCFNNRQHPKAAELQNNSALPTLGRRRTGLAPATGSTLEKWEGALYAEAVRCVLLFGREIRTQIPGKESGVSFSSANDNQRGLR